jgi:hypothetical protein
MWNPLQEQSSGRRELIEHSPDPPKVARRKPAQLPMNQDVS